MRTFAAALFLMLMPWPALALQALDDGDMADVTGSGLALALQDFEFAMAPTSYYEQVGSTPAAGLGCTATGQAAGNYNCWRRGDLRWYGINMSAAGGSNDGYQWNDSAQCNSSSLGCPRGGTIGWFSPFDNPYLLRGWSPAGMSLGGCYLNGAIAGFSAASGCTGPVAGQKSIYEFLAPTLQPNYTFSWWGEIESGSSRNSATQALATNAGRVLKSQNIIRGNAAGSVFRIFQLANSSDATFALYYHSRLRGDYRFSVAQLSTASGGNDSIGQPTLFEGTEGMYFRNVNAFIPLGQLYYQALTVTDKDASGAALTAGNFALVLTPIPSGAAAADIAVQNLHYARNSGDTTGFETARMNNTGGATSAQYQLTHGFSRWGDWYPGSTSGTRNPINLASDGVVFQGCASCDNFIAYADSPVVIDKRGPNYSMQRTQNYTCASGNTGAGCTPNFSNSPASNPYGGPISSPTGASHSDGTNTYYDNPAGDLTRGYPTKVVNLGDGRVEGLMFNSMRIQSCGGVPAC